MKEKKEKGGGYFRYILFGLVAGCLIIFACHRLFGFVIVDGESMNPTYYDGDILHGVTPVDVSKLNRGDVITFHYRGTVLIKRIAGLPGETVSFDDGYLYINGKELTTDLPPMEDPGILAEGPVTLKDDEYFVLGDNRNNSSDSRTIGPVKTDDIQYVVVESVFSFHRRSR